MRDRLLMPIMELCMRDRVCYECVGLHPVPLKGKCLFFCSRKAVQRRICKIGIHYDLQKSIIFSWNMKQNLSDPLIFQFMVYRCGR